MGCIFPPPPCILSRKEPVLPAELRICIFFFSRSSLHLRGACIIQSPTSHLCSLRKPVRGLQQASSVIPHWALPRDGPGTFWGPAHEALLTSYCSGPVFCPGGTPELLASWPSRAQTMTSGSGRGLSTLHSPGCPSAFWAGDQNSCRWSCG